MPMLICTRVFKPRHKITKNCVLWHSSVFERLDGKVKPLLTEFCHKGVLPSFFLVFLSIVLNYVIAVSNDYHTSTVVPLFSHYRQKNKKNYLKNTNVYFYYKLAEKLAQTHLSTPYVIYMLTTVASRCILYL